MLKFCPESHVYELGGVKIPSLSEILTQAGVSDYSNVSEEILRKSAAFGKAVHLACQYFDRGSLDESTLDCNLKPYLTGWINFCEDFKCEWLVIEEPMCSKKLMYGTTPDRIGCVKGRISGVEIKATAKLMASTAIQTAAHAMAYNETAPRGMKILDRYGVLLLPDGVNERNYKMEKYKKKSDESVFRSALNIYNWKKKG